MEPIGNRKFHVRKVAVIGAGPTGLAAAKYLKAQDAFESIVVYEQQDGIGGVWLYHDEAPRSYPAPQRDPFFPPDPPVTTDPTEPPIFPSPMYEKLHANIPKTLMNFSDLSFADTDWIFPSREAIHRYLEEYAKDIQDLIKFCYMVKAVQLKQENGQDRWAVEAHSTVDGQVIKDTYDAIVVANGHYSTPSIPAMKNMVEFQQAHPSIISHSKQYRRAEAFRDKKVIIVGNGPSGIDIALQINQVSKGQALLSVRHPTPPDHLAHTGCEEVGEIEELLLESKGVRFKDGRQETNLDAIVFCTGFLYSYPFLPPALQHELITIGRGVHELYQHMFWIKHPTFVCPALNIKAVPWPLSETQAAVFSAVWSNTLALPPVELMQKWSRELYEKQGEALHVFPGKADGLYINEMHDWAMKASPSGKEPPRWSDELFWQRTIYAEAKLRFERDGCKATTLEQLGYSYKPDWQEIASKTDEISNETKNASNCTIL